MAFQARTNKDTQLIVLGGNNVPVPKGREITVFGEHGIFGTVGVGDDTGSMLKVDYDRIPQSNVAKR